MTSLCDLWDNAKPGTVEYRADLDRARAIAIRTHTHHAVRISRTILQLDPTTVGIELIPLARLLMECAVTVAWLLLTPGSGVALIRDGARERLKALADLSKLGEDPGPAKEQAEAVLSELEDAEGPRAFVFKQRCERLQDGDQLYLTYRVLTAESHSGIGVADFYTLTSDRSPIGVVFNPLAESSLRPATIGFAACMLLLAINAEEIARARPAHTTQIRKAATRLGVTTRIVAADGSELPPRA